MEKFNIIVGVDLDNGIGKNGDLAWKISKDMQYFKRITVCTDDEDNMNLVVMGRKTWESIPKKFRPLPGRINAVLTRNKDFEDEGCVTFNSIDDILVEAKKLKSIEKVFIIGGASIYKQFLDKNLISKIYITKIKKTYNCDVFFPRFEDNFLLEGVSEELEEDGIKLSFEVYKRKT